MIALEAGRRELIAMLGAALLDGLEAVADLHSLDRVDPHHGAREIGVEPLEYRLPEPRRHSRGDDGDARADRVARLAHAPDEVLQFLDAGGIRAEKGVRVHAGEIPRLEHQRAHLREVPVDAHAEPRAQILSRNGSGRDAHHRLARRGTPAAAIIAKAVFLLIRIVRVSGPEAILDLVVVARALILVLDQQSDRGSGGAALEHARQDTHRVALAPLARVLRGSGAPPINVGLQIRLAELEPRRAAVDHAPERGPVTLA